jgi:hypothetical protein
LSKLLRRITGSSDAMNAAKMLVEVLLAGESFAGMSLAFRHCASKLLLWAAMLAMNFSLVSQQTTGIGKALKFGALRLWAPVWSIVFVHVFATIQSAFVIWPCRIHV